MLHTVHWDELTLLIFYNVNSLPYLYLTYRNKIWMSAHIKGPRYLYINYLMLCVYFLVLYFTAVCLTFHKSFIDDFCKLFLDTIADTQKMSKISQDYWRYSIGHSCLKSQIPRFQTGKPNPYKIWWDQKMMALNVFLNKIEIMLGSHKTGTKILTASHCQLVYTIVSNVLNDNVRIHIKKKSWELLI